MKAFLEKIENDYLDDFVYISKYVLLNRGIEVVDFDGTIKNSLARLNPSINDICIGSVEACSKFFQLIGIDEPKYLGYPEELKQYYKRDMWYSKFQDVKHFPVFIKPRHEVKLFTGTVLNTQENYDFVKTYYQEVKPETELYCSDILEFLSEYRCFVHDGKLKGIQWYAGDFKLTLNCDHIARIEQIIQKFYSAPIAYTLDIGIIEYKPDIAYYDIAIVEVNDMWAIGSYGFNAKDYVKMTIDRFNQIKGITK